MKHSPQLGTLQAKVTPSKETSDSKQLGEWRMNKYLHFIGCYFLPIGLTILLAFLLQDYFSRIQIHAKSRNNKMAGAPEIVVLPSDVEIKERICEAVITIAEKSIKDHGFFSVGFSGGSLAKFLAQGLKDRAGIGKSDLRQYVDILLPYGICQVVIFSFSFLKIGPTGTYSSVMRDTCPLTVKTVLMGTSRQTSFPMSTSKRRTFMP